MGVYRRKLHLKTLDRNPLEEKLRAKIGKAHLRPARKTLTERYGHLTKENS